MSTDKKIGSDHIKDATEEQKARLLAQMDVTMVQKMAFASAHFQLHDGARILDIGCANGKGSYHIAALNPRLHVVGIDYDQRYIDEARASYDLPNLEFVQGDARNLDLDGEKFDAIFNSSVMHEIYSFSDYGTQAARQALDAQLAHLKPGGVILFRDFMRPENPDAMVYLDLPPGKTKGRATGPEPRDMSYPDLLRFYAKIADTMKPEEQQGFFLEHVGTLKDGWERFYLPHDRAYEFIWRKEYRERFVPEAREKYGVWTADEYRDIPESAGARVVYTAPYRNPWIVKNWHENKFRLYNEDMKPLMGPPSNYIAVVQKTEDGKTIRLREHKLSGEAPSYLQLDHYENTESGAVYDMVSRPGAVYDVIPYGTNERGQVVVYAKSGYPRPIINAHPRQMSPNLDGKSWSGHMVEPLAIANQQGSVDDAVRSVLQDRAGFKKKHVGVASEGLSYFTAPGDVNEKVSSVFVPVKKTPYEKDLKGNFSGFSSDGTMRAFEIQDLLRGVQVGMLPEARLEMNVYTLMRRLGITPKDWIGDSFDVTSESVDTPESFSAVTDNPKAVFQRTSQRAGYFKTLRSVFMEEANRQGMPEVISVQELEFAVPDQRIGGTNISTNSIMAAPVIKDDKTGEIMIGVQRRDFPSVQEKDGHSTLLTIPGFRLPSSVKNLDEAQDYVSEKFSGANKNNIRALGESYFPSMGILPNRVFPYIVTGVNPDQCPGCHFVPLRELFENIDNLHDAHLILTVNRTVHALGLWEDYTRDLKPQSNAKLTLGE